MAASPLTWLFFSFSGRLSRQAYALAGMLLYLVRLYPVYRIIQAPDHETATLWGGVFVFAAGVSLVLGIPLAAKRFQDFGKSGWFGLFFMFADFLMYAVLCFVPGNRGPNRFGVQTNAPR